MATAAAKRNATTPKTSPMRTLRARWAKERKGGRKTASSPATVEGKTKTGGGGK